MNLTINAVNFEMAEKLECEQRGEGTYQRAVCRESGRLVRRGYRCLPRRT